MDWGAGLKYLHVVEVNQLKTVLMGNCVVWILITKIRKYLSTQKREKNQSKPTHTHMHTTKPQ